MKVKEYFSDKELVCPCGCGTMPDMKSVEMLYALRILIMRPLKINSAARCVDHNADVGGIKTSAHIHGKAFDIDSDSGLIEYDLIRIAQLVGFTGIGINNNNFIHVDNYHLNSTCKTSFKTSSKTTRSHIIARFREGFKIEDFFKVIDSKFDRWGTDVRMMPYLRPQTLFGTKFESYLNESKITKQNQYGFLE